MALEVKGSEVELTKDSKENIMKTQILGCTTVGELEALNITDLTDYENDIVGYAIEANENNEGSIDVANTVVALGRDNEALPFVVMPKGVDGSKNNCTVKQALELGRDGDITPSWWSAELDADSIAQAEWKKEHLESFPGADEDEIHIAMFSELYDLDLNENLDEAYAS